MKRLKLSFSQSVRVRRERFNETRGEIAKEFGISRALVTKTCQYSDYEILKMYSKYDNPAFKYMRISSLDWDDNVQGKVAIEYTDGPLVGAYAVVPLYDLLESHYVPSFSTLMEMSKKHIIARVLHTQGFARVSVVRVGDKTGVEAQFQAVADGQRLSWQDLTNINEFRTILRIKGESNG